MTKEATRATRSQLDAAPREDARDTPGPTSAAESLEALATTATTGTSGDLLAGLEGTDPRTLEAAARLVANLTRAARPAPLAPAEVAPAGPPAELEDDQPADDRAAGARSPRRRYRTRAERSRQGFGTVRRLASGRWQARYTDTDGVRRPAPRTFATRREAEDWITTRRADHVRGEWRSPELGAIPLREYLAEYLAARVELAPRTRAGYDRLAATWLLPELAHPTGRPVPLARVLLRDLTPALVRDWHAAALAEAQRRAVAHLAARDRERTRRAKSAARAWAAAQGMPVKATGRVPQAVLDAFRAAGEPAAATLDLPPTAPDRDAGRVQVARAYALLRSVLNVAYSDGLIAANPCTIRGAGSTPTKERTIATPEEVGRIAELVPARYAAAVHVAAWSSLRAGELFALTRAHVDLTRGTVRVDRALVELPGQPAMFGPPKTRSSVRTVHLPGPVLELLRDHLTTYTRPGPDALVFADDAGKPLSTARRTKWFRAACAQVGRHDLRWHDLRHTGATIAAQSGATLRDLQERLGHATPRAAMIYQHSSPERDRELAERMAERITGPVHPIAGTTPLRAVGS